MKSAYIKKTNPSNYMNVWRIMVKDKSFLIAPAHSVICSKGGIWKESDYLKGLVDLNWKISLDYLRTRELFSDLAWVEVGNSQDSLSLKTEIEKFPFEVNIFTRQPYNSKGEKYKNDASFAGICGVIYQSPEDVYEILGVGFKGMSGAVVVEKDATNFVGMFVRRAKYLPLIRKQDREHGKKFASKMEPKNATSIHQKPIILLKKPNSGNSQSNYQGTDTDSNPKNVESENQSEFNKLYDLLENKFSNMDYKLQKIDSNLQKLDSEVLKKSDMDRLHEIEALRRSIILPAKSIEKIISENFAENLKEVKGKSVEYFEN